MIKIKTYCLAPRSKNSSIRRRYYLALSPDRPESAPRKQLCYYRNIINRNLSRIESETSDMSYNIYRLNEYNNNLSNNSNSETKREAIARATYLIRISKSKIMRSTDRIVECMRALFSESVSIGEYNKIAKDVFRTMNSAKQIMGTLISSITNEIVLIPTYSRQSIINNINETMCYLLLQ